MNTSTHTNTTTPTNTSTPTDNGVNTQALLGARDAMGGTPAAAAFTFRAANHWVNGTHSRTTVEKFFGIGDEQRHKQAYVLDTDHPEIFAAADNGITPPEMVLVSLAGCLSAGIASVAQNRGIQLNSVTAHVEGHMDLRGILGVDADVRNGFDSISLRYSIDADASADDIRAVVAQSQKRSAVFDVITNPTAVVVEVEVV